MVKVVRHRFFRTQNIKTLKTVFNSFTSVKIFYTPLGHITQNISTKKLCKNSARLEEEILQEPMTYLAHY